MILSYKDLHDISIMKIAYQHWRLRLVKVRHRDNGEVTASAIVAPTVDQLAYSLRVETLCFLQLFLLTGTAADDPKRAAGRYVWVLIYDLDTAADDPKRAAGRYVWVLIDGHDTVAHAPKRTGRYVRVLIDSCLH